MKKIILTYYFVWFKSHKNSKYAHQFNHYWYHALLQVCVTTFLCLVLTTFLVELLFHILIIKIMAKYVFLTTYLILPSLVLYHLIFNFYGVKKANDSPARFGIKITKTTKVMAWVTYFGTLLLVLLFLFFQKELRY